MAVSFHRVEAPLLACDDCGCAVEQTDRWRAVHQRWHEEREEIASNVVDLRERISA